MRYYLITYVKGALMGIADVIPGVSGGTIAFITGIYEKFIGSLKAFDLEALKLFFKGRWKSFDKKVNLRFLLTLFAGIMTAILSLAKLLQYLLMHYPEAVWSFFFGLIAASAIVIAFHIKKWRFSAIISLAVGIGFILWISSANVTHTPDTAPYLFGAGAIAITAMLLPGISGSFILVLLNKYTFVISLLSSLVDNFRKMAAALADKNFEAVKTIWTQTEVWLLFVFILGTLAGMAVFSRVITWLFKKYHDLTIALLVGFLIGSLYKVWPWKETLEWYISSHGEKKSLVERNIFPAEIDGYFFLSVGLAAAGFLAVYFMEKLGQKKAS